MPTLVAIDELWVAGGRVGDFVLMLILLAGFVVGVFVTWLLNRGKAASAVAEATAAANNEGALKAQTIASLEAQLLDVNTRFAALQSAHEALQSVCQDERMAKAQFEERTARLPALLEALAEGERKLTLEVDVHRATYGELAAEREQHGRATEQLAATRDTVARLERQLADERECNTSAKTELATLKDRLSASKAVEAALQSRVDALAPLEEKLATQLALQQKLAADLAQAREEVGGIRAALKAQQDKCAELSTQLATEKGQREAAEAARVELTSELSALKTQLEADRDSAAKQLALLDEARQKMSIQFENLAQQIFEAKGRRFAEQNQQNLGVLLGPLKTQIDEFKNKVEQVYVEEGKGRSELKNQVEMLARLNKTLSDEAKNLTRALKGDNKAQGSWGELILKDLLEQLGLTSGVEFVEQASYTREDGSRAQPDVVLNLPEGRKLVIDAKVSLVDYTRYVSAESDTEREMALAAHLASVHSHLKGLSLREYQKLHSLDSIDFVLMFLPIEPAFMLAATHDRDLFREAWDKNVLLVSPSTLISVVRTVAHLWRQEKRNSQTEAIVKCGTQLYESVCAFVADFEKLGNRLRQVQESYESANKRLTHGNNNIIGKAGRLKELGISSSKLIDPVRLERARLNEELPTEAMHADEAAEA